MFLQPIRNRLPLEIPQVDQVDRAVFLRKEWRERMRIGVLNDQQPFVALRIRLNMHTRMVAAQKHRIFVRLIKIFPKQHALLHNRLLTVAIIHSGHRLQIGIGP